FHVFEFHAALLSRSLGERGHRSTVARSSMSKNARIPDMPSFLTRLPMVSVPPGRQRVGPPAAAESTTVTARRRYRVVGGPTTVLRPRVTPPAGAAFGVNKRPVALKGQRFASILP